MFWQNTLLIPKEVYHEKEKNSNSIYRNKSGVSITNCKLQRFSKTCQLLTTGRKFDSKQKVESSNFPVTLTHSAAHPRPELGSKASPAFEGGVKKRRSGSTLSKPRPLVLSQSKD